MEEEGEVEEQKNGAEPTEERRNTEVREGRGGEVETKQNQSRITNIQHGNHKRRNMKEEELKAKREGRKNRKERP